MDKKKAIKILEGVQNHAENQADYYSPKNKEIAQMWRDKADAYELARRALLKEVDYDLNMYGD